MIWIRRPIEGLEEWNLAAKEESNPAPNSTLYTNFWYHDSEPYAIAEVHGDLSLQLMADGKNIILSNKGRWLSGWQYEDEEEPESDLRPLIQAIRYTNETWKCAGFFMNEEQISQWQNAYGYSEIEKKTYGEGFLVKSNPNFFVESVNGMILLPW